MRSEQDARRVTVYVGETDHAGGTPLYRAIVAMLHAEGIAGATVTRGIMGYGQSSHVHSAHLLDVSEDLPITIVFIDSAENVERVLGKLDELIGSGVVVTEQVRIVRYAK
jgi:PII-like signaling protein